MEQKKIELEKLDLSFAKDEEPISFVKVNCPSCNEQVAAENLELAAKLGKCGSCNALFSLEKVVSDLHHQGHVMEKIERPQGVESYHFNNEMEIELDQPYPILDTLILSIVPFVFIMALLLYFMKDEGGALPVALLSIPFIAKSILRYIRKKLHKTIVSVNKSQIHLQYKPNNLRKERTFDASSIEQVYVGPSTDGVTLFFVINGEDGQRHEKVLRRFTNLMHAKYIEQEIETYLNIQNRKVIGEY